jgi:uncharacterized protein YukE
MIYDRGEVELGRILVYPHRLEQMSRVTQETARNFQQLTERLIRSVHSAAWESSQKVQLEQLLSEWQRISHALAETLEEQSRFLHKKARDFQQADDEAARSLSFGTISTGLMSTIAYNKLQNVKGIKISNPKMILDILTINGTGSVQEENKDQLSADGYATLPVEESSKHYLYGAAVVPDHYTINHAEAGEAAIAASSYAGADTEIVATGEIGAGISVGASALFEGIDFGGSDSRSNETELVKQRLKQFMKIS